MPLPPLNPLDDWDDAPPPSSPVVSRQQLAEARPRRTATELKAHRAKRQAEAEQKAAGAASRRTSFNRSAVGRARNQDITDLTTDEYRKALSSRGMQTEGGRLEKNPRARIGMSKSQIYGGMGIHYGGHGYGDQQLPGFEDPHRAPEPRRWEDLTPREHATVHAHLAQAGTTIDQMSKDFGAQLDQAHFRAVKATGSPTTFTQHFYGDHPADAPAQPTDRPKDLMRQASKETGLPFSVTAGAVALTSPNTKFTAGAPGHRYSPNVETARSAIKQHQEGVPSEKITLGEAPRGGSNQGYPANSQKVGRMLEHIEAGGTMGTFTNPPTRSTPHGKSPFGPKTGPFVNSFEASTPDFLVSDVHTGGGGMLPHLDTAKPQRKDPETGELKFKTRYDDQKGWIMAADRDKSEREKGIERAHFHSAADFAARKALHARGVGSRTPEGRHLNVSVREPQAAQWGEEQIQRKALSPKLDLPSHESAYPGHPQTDQGLNREQFQGRLF